MRIKNKATVKKGIVAININIKRRGGREDIEAAKKLLLMALMCSFSWDQ